MAEIIGGVGCSHVPAVGAALDNGKSGNEVWKPYFDTLPPAREWIEEKKPDVCIVVYNDHASAFSMQLIPTFTLGVAPEFQPADEGFGPRKVPTVEGDPDLAWHLAESLILDEFDMTIANEMDVDHGLTVPLSVMFGQPENWPTKVIPLAVNVVQFPPPTGHRCYMLGKALRRAIDSYPGAERVVVFGTGGMSHQLQGERAGLVNSEWDSQFMDNLVNNPAEQAQVPHVEYLREAGTEGVELVMWLIMRGAMNDSVEEVYRSIYVPTSNTSNGLIVLDNA